MSHFHYFCVTIKCLKDKKILKSHKMSQYIIEYNFYIDDTHLPS